VAPTSAERPAVAWALVVALLAYAVVALAWGRWWLSGAAAPVVAWLLWRRHPRARFSAYVLLSAVLLRGAFTRSWASAAFAGAAILLLQAPAARRAWPRLRPGATRGDRMPGP